MQIKLVEKNRNQCDAVVLPTVKHTSPWSNHFYLTSNPLQAAGIRSEFTGNPLFFSSPLSPLSFYFSFLSFMSSLSFCVSFPSPVLYFRSGVEKLSLSVTLSVGKAICPCVRLPLLALRRGSVWATTQTFVVPIKIPSDVCGNAPCRTRILRFTGRHLRVITECVFLCLCVKGRRMTKLHKAYSNVNNNLSLSVNNKLVATREKKN